MAYHLYPVDDLREHALKGERCWCRPEIDYEGAETIVIHNALDGREAFENGRKTS